MDVKRGKRQWKLTDYVLAAGLLALIAFFLIARGMDAQDSGDSGAPSFFFGIAAALGALVCGAIAAIAKGNQIGRD